MNCKEITIENLLKLKALTLVLEKEASLSLSMSTFVSDDFPNTDMKEGEENHNCGTVCCLLGHTPKVLPFNKEELDIIADDIGTHLPWSYNNSLWSKYCTRIFPEIVPKSNVYFLDKGLSKLIFHAGNTDSWLDARKRIDFAISCLKGNKNDEDLRNYISELNI